jgi:predicted RNase H-like nuclease (RuvC/YqgF family)
MKETLYRISSTLISLLLVLILCSLVYSNKTTHKTIIDIADKIDSVKSTTERYSSSSNKALVDRVEELTRMNERLEMEAAAMRDELSAFGGWWKDWKSKNDIGVEVVE